MGTSVAPGASSGEKGTRRHANLVSCAETRLVFALARSPLHGRAATLEVPRDTNWRQLFQRASDENALIALRDGLRRAVRGTIPSDAERQIAILSLDRQDRMRRLGQRLEQLLLVLNRAGIDVLLLKGSALASTVYGSFAARAMRDIDLLVRPERADEARTLMFDLNWTADPELPGDPSYSTHHHLPPLRDVASSGLRLEIHRSVLPTGHAFGFTNEEIWRAARPTHAGGARALVMQPAHHAVHIAIHFAWSHMMKLGAWHAFRDLDTLVAAGVLDWNEFVAVASRWRAASCCYWTLRLGEELSGLEVPDAVMRELRPRLPDRVEHSLTRHFVNGIARVEPTCPSARLDQALWSLAIQPRRNGHGRVRPWLVSLDLLCALTEKLAQTDDTSSASPFRRMRLSRRYISAILA